MYPSYFNLPKNSLDKPTGHVSLLLGAGFSVGKGYPTAGQLNGRITGLQENDFIITGTGTLEAVVDGNLDLNNQGSGLEQKLFTLELIKFYATLKGDFNYESFYDYYSNLSKPGVFDLEFDSFWKKFLTTWQPEIGVEQLLSGHDRLFNQIIIQFLVDGEGNRYYESIHHCKPSYTNYTGFLNCLEAWGQQNIIHVHTLNHDIFFESLRNSDWLKGELSDGFVENGSPFYGKYHGEYHVRLSYFTDEYSKRYRLYKLHGSVDQYPFSLPDKDTLDFVKIKPGIADFDLYKEIEKKDGMLGYERCWINYHSTFLSGTTSKILRYDDPYYLEVFNHFKENLQESIILVIIGYGGGDSKVNEIIESHFARKDNIFLVEPFPHDITHEFIKRFNAKLIVKLPNDLTLADFVITP